MLAWLPNLLWSCGLLLLPAIAWNAALAGRLPPALRPEVFDRAAPAALKTVEHVSRLAVFLLPFAMPLDLADPVARGGLALWAAGTAIYFAAWLALIAAPGSAWSGSRFGMLAPTYTPVLWLAGIALAGTRLFGVEGWRGWMYLVPAVIFLAGLAPLACDSGEKAGERHIKGGRAFVRTGIYLAALAAARFNPQLSDDYKRLRNAGKKTKVAITAIMRKLVVLANVLIKEDRQWKPILP